MPRVQVLISSVAIALASAGDASYYWAGKNGDALRTGRSPYAASSDLSTGPTWSYVPPQAVIVRSHPLIDDHLNIYLAIVSFDPGADTGSASAGPGGIIKFSAEGEQLWNYTASSPMPAGPALHDGLLYFATANGYAGALDMETGEEVWNVLVGIEVPPDTHSMTAAEGFVIVSVRTENRMEIPCPSPNDEEPPLYVMPPEGPENQLVALDTSGHVLWRFNTDTIMYNSLSAIVDGSVVVADTNGRTYRLDLATGQLLWKHESADYRNFTGSSTGGAIVGPNRVVYVTSIVNVGGNIDDYFGRLSAYALETGQLLWRQDLELPASNAAAVGPIGPDGDGPLAVVIVIGENPDMPPQKAGHKRGIAVAFDAETGERLAWQHEIFWNHAAAAGDSVNHLCLPDDASNPAIGGDGTVYFGFEDGRFYALRDADGDGSLSPGEVSYFDGGNAYQGSPGIAPGMLVSCPCNGMHVFTSPAAAELV